MSGRVSTRRSVHGPDELVALAGEDLGVSEWLTVTQDHADEFEQATGPGAWFTNDAPDGPTVVPSGSGDVQLDRSAIHGHLTLSLIPEMMSSVVHVAGFRTFLHYGYNKVRFVSPVRVGTRIRLGMRLLTADRVGEAVQATFEMTVATEGSARPSCVAESVFRLYI